MFLDEKSFLSTRWLGFTFLFCFFYFSKRVRPCYIEDSAGNVRNAMHIPYAHCFFFLGGGGWDNNRFLLDQTLLDGNLGIDD